MYPSGEKRFLAINKITIISLFALILAGGIVRGTGAGMGCPDWPKCFGSYVPPTSTSQLPKGYQQKFVAERLAKNERFAKTLDVFGYGLLADKLRQDKSIEQPEEFNVSKTWTEYINRLIGAITGAFLLCCAVFSATYLNKRSRIFILSLLNVILVAFQAWLGSIVVSTNLLAWVVTVHMLVAIAIMAISIYTYFQARIFRDRYLLDSKKAGFIRNISLFVLILTILQIILGTEVREQIDAIDTGMNHLNRAEWVNSVGAKFNWHRDLAILVIVANSAVFLLVRKRYSFKSYQFKFASYIIVLLALQVLSGLALAYLALPSIDQAAHVFLATLLFGSQFYLFLLLKNNKTFVRRSTIKT